MTPGVAEQVRPVDTARTELLTVGVEEEFLLTDPATGAAVPAVHAVLERVPPELAGQVQLEFQTSQVEIGSPPGLELAALRHSLALLRSGVADAAEQAGARLVAVGTGPVPGPVPPVVDKPRYHQMVERLGLLVPSPGSNGMHVHVGVGEPDLAVEVLNHLRPWLPILHAATANSPFYEGADTDYASWRSMLWERWPSVAPTPYLESYAHYQRLIDELIATGIMLDDGMLYWYSRLSATYPTVEIRIGDVCPSLDDTILIAALCRALVATVVQEIETGRPAPQVEHHRLVGAHWRAAHDGLEGRAVDPETGDLRPAWHVLRDLFERVRPQLDRHGDLGLVTYLLGKLHSHGTGAARQRAIFDRSGQLSDVLDELARETRG
ncbi:glutamate--cysteine ligase [Plantactinospora sp. KBS50]|uniref:carboxylate-amine ligase n=1 Tax=Plantactinospora sp. KBS50 TaxID=2024580 RepID=UPI000BAB07FD|nr:glutamate--cysteine ligase [Plantactinospora sp. KBS50]ASW56539.1 carboxylate--amine ligase [Plantactinospora sp. KBS50]